MADLRDLDRESRIAEGGLVDPRILDQIGTRSALTCPSCNGVLWRMRGDRPLRYRCHTHAIPGTRFPRSLSTTRKPRKRKMRYGRQSARFTSA